MACGVHALEIEESTITRVKYVDDLSVLEIIPRCSTSLLPFVARDICSYASSHGMV